MIGSLHGHEVQCAKLGPSDQRNRRPVSCPRNSMPLNAPVINKSDAEIDQLKFLDKQIKSGLQGSAPFSYGLGTLYYGVC